MPDLSQYPRQLRAAIAPMIAAIDGLSDQMEAGDITPTQWRREMDSLTERYMSAAAMAGARTTEIEALNALIANLVDIQRDFLDQFRDDIRKGGWLAAYRSRAQMYGEAIQQAYWYGDIVRQAGRMLPLPAVPGEGSQCLSRCKCHWRIVTVNKANGDYDAFWETSPVESCQTCVERKAQWGPLRIRGGMLQ